MITQIQRRHAVIKCLSEINPSFDQFYENIILKYNPINNSLSNKFNSIKNDIIQMKLRNYLSHYTANNLCFELLYKKLIDPSFDENDFVEIIQYN
jgi:hypothetical protein